MYERAREVHQQPSSAVAGSEDRAAVFLGVPPEHTVPWLQSLLSHSSEIFADVHAAVPTDRQINTYPNIARQTRPATGIAVPRASLRHTTRAKETKALRTHDDGRLFERTHSAVVALARGLYFANSTRVVVSKI